MKKIVALALLLPALAHARYEEFVDYEGHTPGVSSLPFYFYGPMLAWLYIVWDKGWLYRMLPIGASIAGGVCWYVWGIDGLGAAAVGTFLLALFTGAWWACEKD